MQDSKLVKEGLITGALYFILLLFTLFLPLLSIFLIFLLPLPIIYYSGKFGWKPASILTLFLVLAGSMFAISISLPLIVLTGLTGLMIGSAIHQRLTPYETWARGSLGFVIGIVFIFVFIQLFFDTNISNELNQAIEESMQLNEQMMAQLGVELTEDEIEAVTEQMQYFIDLLPVIFVLMAMFFSLIIQWLSYKIINKIDNKSLRFPPFRNFQLPRVFIWLYFVAILFTWFNLEKGSPLYIVVTNVTNLAGLIISLQGMSFILYYAYKKRLSKAVPIISIIFIVLFLPIGLYLIRILGIIDLGFNLRERLTETKK